MLKIEYEGELRLAWPTMWVQDGVLYNRKSRAKLRTLHGEHRHPADVIAKHYKRSVRGADQPEDAM
jgi:hypothetical protein